MLTENNELQSYDFVIDNSSNEKAIFLRIEGEQAEETAATEAETPKKESEPVAPNTGSEAPKTGETTESTKTGETTENPKTDNPGTDNQAPKAEVPKKTELKQLNFKKELAIRSNYDTFTIPSSIVTENGEDWIKNIYRISSGKWDYKVAWNDLDIENGEYLKSYHNSNVEIFRPGRSRGKIVTVTIYAKGYETYDFVLDNSGETKVKIVKVEKHPEK